jgi:hypothetical protein
LRVNWTALASARYSRCRDTAATTQRTLKGVRLADLDPKRVVEDVIIGDALASLSARPPMAVCA